MKDNKSYICKHCGCARDCVSPSKCSTSDYLSSTSGDCLDVGDGGRGNPVYAHHYVQTTQTIFYPRNPEYISPGRLLEYVDELGLPREYFEARVEGYSTYKCMDCGSTHARPIVRGGKYNIYLGLHNAEISCKRFLRPIREKLHNPYMLRVVVTLPNGYTVDETKEIAKKFVNVLQDVYYKGRLCAKVLIHPTGTNLQWHPHFELWFPNYIYDPNKDKLIRVQPYLNVRALRTLLFKLGIDKPQLWVEYYNLEKRYSACLDAMIYASRPFSFDVYMLLKKGKKPDPEMAKFCLAYKPRSINLGWATRYRKILGYREEKTETVTCPFCGGLAVKVDMPACIKTAITRVRGRLFEVKIEGFS